MNEVHTISATSVEFVTENAAWKPEPPKQYSTVTVGFDAVKHLLTNRPITRRKVKQPAALKKSR